jgi:predicted nucleic acid-binding protein
LSIVIDCSIALAWYFVDETTKGTDEVLDRVAREGGVVPPLWPFEVANGLQVAVRRQRITTTYRDQIFSRLGRLPIATDSRSEMLAWSDTVELAERHGLTVYDAAYLELAQRRRFPLATLDRALIKACLGEAVPSLGT